MNNLKTYNLLGMCLNNISYSEILSAIHQSIQNQKQISICYANVNSISLSFNNEKVKNLFSDFDIVHPDGFGVFLGLKILLGKSFQSKRISGSDLYEHLIKYGIDNKYNFFFFGDKDITLNQININYPLLKVVGSQNGYNFDNKVLIDKINHKDVDILIVGLGSPKQEEWIISNKEKINSKVIIAVGDGIKVFAGIKKRGPKFLQILGLEWIVRLFYEPKRLWRRYIVGIPLFILRILKYKLLKQ